MRNLLVNHRVTIEADFTAEQWDLYTDKEDVDDVAHDLNKSLQFYVNKGFERKEVLSQMHEVMNKYKSYGAYDTEPRFFLERILSEIYKE